jgi:hypothetical protein
LKSLPGRSSDYTFRALTHHALAARRPHGYPAAGEAQGLLRWLVIVVALLAAAVWVEPSWKPEERSLTLRVRSNREIMSLVRDRSRELGRRVIEAAVERRDTPAVSAAPATEAQPDEITADERRELDRLIERKLREY